MFGVDAVDLSLQLQDLLGLDGDVCGLTLDTQRSHALFQFSEMITFVGWSTLLS